MNGYPFADFGTRPGDVIVEVSDAHGPARLVAFVAPQEIEADEFAREREELMLRSAWLRVRGRRDAFGHDFARECTRLREIRDPRRAPARPTNFG